MPSQQSNNSPKLLTITEAANQLRISRWMIYQLIRGGELKTITIASRRFITTEDLDDFIKTRREINNAAQARRGINF